MAQKKAPEKRCVYKLANGKPCGIRLWHHLSEYCRRHRKVVDKKQSREYYERKKAGKTAGSNTRLWKRSEVCPLCERPFFPSVKNPNAKLCQCNAPGPSRLQIGIGAVTEYNPATGQKAVRFVYTQRLNTEAVPQ